MSNSIIVLICKISKEADDLFDDISDYSKVRSSVKKRTQLAIQLKNIFKNCYSDGCSREAWDLITKSRKKLKLLKQILNNMSKKMVGKSNITNYKMPDNIVNST